MKNFKLNKIIRVWLAFSGVLVFALCCALICGKFINPDYLSGSDKNRIYYFYKYFSAGTLLVILPGLILSLINIIEHSHKSCFFIMSLIKNIFCCILTSICIVFLFCFTKKYVIKIELWYGYSSIFISLLVFLDCLIFDSLHIYTKKFQQNKSRKVGEINLLLFWTKNSAFKFEVVWVSLSCILGMMSTFWFKTIAQITAAIIMILLIETSLQMGIVYYLNSQTRKNNTNAYLYFLLLNCLLTCFVAFSYFAMFPVKIIGTIKINYGLTFSIYISSLLITPPTYLISSKLLIQNRD